jgi:hypothetical protein
VVANAMTTAVWKSRPMARRPAPAGRAARRCALAVALALAAALSIAVPARADVGATIIERCTHGQPLGGFRQQDYRRALQELPAEVEEYSDCANLIRRAELNAAGAGPAGSASEGAPPIPLTPREVASLRAVSHTGAAAQRLDGRVVRPGVVQASVSSALSTLPTPLLALLALLSAFALLWGGSSIRDRVRARRPS